MKILVAGGKTILHLIRGDGSPAAVCGPQSEYGDKELNEYHRRRPWNNCGATKQLSETPAAQYAGLYGSQFSAGGPYFLYFYFACSKKVKYWNEAGEAVLLIGLFILRFIVLTGKK
jgi:hypothetical protein